MKDWFHTRYYFYPNLLLLSLINNHEKEQHRWWSNPFYRALALALLRYSIWRTTPRLPRLLVNKIPIYHPMFKMGRRYETFRALLKPQNRSPYSTAEDLAVYAFVPSRKGSTLVSPLVLSSPQLPFLPFFEFVLLVITHSTTLHTLFNYHPLTTRTETQDIFGARQTAKRWFWEFARAVLEDWRKKTYGKSSSSLSYPSRRT